MESEYSKSEDLTLPRKQIDEQVLQSPKRRDTLNLNAVKSN